MQRTKLCRLTVVAVLVAAVLFFACPKTALAQTDTLYNVSYFSNAHNSSAPDATLREINDGATIIGTYGDLCANIYVFDATEELKECCSCRLTPNHLLTLSVNQDLTRNAVTGGNVPRGVIKVVTTIAPVPPAMCDPANGTVSVAPGLDGWLTHIQKNTVGASTTYSVTEEELASSTLSAGELADLQEDCMVGIELGSGQGVCATHVTATIGGETATDFCVDAGK